MSLFLSRTWEHALLARVVKEAVEVAEKKGGYLGRTAIQKIVYFLQVLEVPMRYRFEVSHYGPFCSSILGDTEWLLADDVITESSPKPEKYSKFTLGRACHELLEKHADKLMQYEDTIKSTVKALLPLKPEHLELIATLDYAFREVKATLGKKPPKKKVIARFRDFKGDKFADKEIEATFDQLDAAGLFT
jgi:uncharacterized protein YwgA